MTPCPCAANVECAAVGPSFTNPTCGPCPDNYTGNGTTCTLSASPVAIRVQMVLALEFTVYTSNPTTFVQQLTQDICSVIRNATPLFDCSRLRIFSVSEGSLVVIFDVLPPANVAADSTSPAAAVQTIQNTLIASTGLTNSTWLKNISSPILQTTSVSTVLCSDGQQLPQCPDTPSSQSTSLALIIGVSVAAVVVVAVLIILIVVLTRKQSSTKSSSSSNIPKTTELTTIT